MDNSFKNEELEAAAIEESETGKNNPAEFNKEAQKRSKFEVKSIKFNDKTKQYIKAKKADWVANLVYLDGEKFSFKGRDYLFPIYNGRFPQLLLKYSRQCEKSSYLANNIIADSAIVPYNKAVYVAPSYLQTRQFSAGKLTPWMEDSPVIKRYLLSSSVSRQVFEKGMTNGSLIFLRSAFLNADRIRGLSANMLCVSGKSKIILASGSQLKIEDFIKTQPIGQKIWTLNETTWVPEVDEVIAAAITGVKDTVRVTTATGSYIELTSDHKVLTFNGWKEAGKLTKDDFLIEPESISTGSLVKDRITITEDDCFIMGCLLGDGRHQKFGRTSFGTCDLILKEAFTSALDRVGAKYSTIASNRISNLSGQHLTEYTVNIYGGRSGYKSLLSKLGIIGQSTADKNVTFFDYLHTKEQVAAALNGLIATDGYVCVMDSAGRKKNNRSLEIGFVSTSRNLAESVRLLFRRLGVVARIRERSPKNGISVKKQFVVHIRDTTNFLKAAAILRVPGKLAKENFDKIRGEINCPNLNSLKGNQVPVSNTCIQSILKKHGISKEQYRIKTGSAFNSYSKKTNIEKIRSAATMCKDKYLDNLSKRKVIYTQVVSVVPAGRQIVYDLTLKKNHNFFANMLCVHNCIDEIQNFISANIPVIMEVLSHAENPTAMFAGTPLTNDNILEQTWQDSSQCEWLVRCERHDPVHYNFLDERCIGLNGPICNKCGKPINPANGKWVAFSTERYIMGFHLNQIMVPWMQSGDKWREIVHKYNTYSKGLFYNEVLGISYDSASKPVTRTELIACTTGKRRLKKAPDEWTRNWQCVMGVDWGTGSDGTERDEKGRLRTASYTVVCIGAYIAPNKFHPFFYRRYKGDDAIPTNCIKDIIQLAKWFNCVLIGTDWGFGWAANDQLESAFGMQKIIKYQYVGVQRERMRYDSMAHKVIVNRTEVMSDFFADIKKTVFEFPVWEDAQEYLVDIEHIFAEVSSLGMLKYDHKKTEPDDAAHATIFCKETADKLIGKW